MFIFRKSVNWRRFNVFNSLTYDIDITRDTSVMDFFQVDSPMTRQAMVIGVNIDDIGEIG